MTRKQEKVLTEQLKNSKPKKYDNSTPLGLGSTRKKEVIAPLSVVSNTSHEKVKDPVKRKADPGEPSIYHFGLTPKTILKD